MAMGESAFFGNIWISQFHMPKVGMEIAQHEHAHDHVSLLTSGSVSVSVNGGPEKIFTAPNIVLIKKNLRHKIISLSDDTLWYCVFALRDIDGNVADQYDNDNLPIIDPIFFGAESLVLYKGLYEDSQKEIEELKNINNTLVLKYNELVKVIKNGWYSNNISFELK